MTWSLQALAQRGRLSQGTGQQGLSRGTWRKCNNKMNVSPAEEIGSTDSVGSRPAVTIVALGVRTIGSPPPPTPPLQPSDLRGDPDSYVPTRRTMPSADLIRRARSQVRHRVGWRAPLGPPSSTDLTMPELLFLSSGKPIWGGEMSVADSTSLPEDVTVRQAGQQSTPTQS